MSANITECSFVGSFFKLDQLPKSRLPQVAFAGRSNVGKSSLLNRLVGRKKMAKVSSTPGKTRSLNFFLVNRKYHLVDLPGYGYAKVPKAVSDSWGDLIEGYLETGPDLIGLVLLLDCRRDPTDQDKQLLNWLARRELPAIVALTKVDKLTRDKTNRKIRQVENELGLSVIPFSVVSGIGKNELLGTIASLIDDHYQRMKA